MNFVKNLQIHIFFQRESLAIRLRGKDIGNKAEREIYISPSRYFNQRLVNYSLIFASDSDYIFFAHSVLKKLQLNSQIKIAMRKVAYSTLTAVMLSKYFKENDIARDKAYSFMNAIKGTSVIGRQFCMKYWQW